MVSTTVRVRRHRDAAAATEQATHDHLIDMATVGQNRAEEVIYDEATDTGQLARSRWPQRGPATLRDGSVAFGWTADYAEDVDQGTPPHHVPIAALMGWVRRTFGISDEEHAYVSAEGVQDKIAAEGTEGVHFVRKGLEAMRQWRTAHGLDDYLAERL